MGGARAQPDLRPGPLASFRDAAFEPNPPAGDDRDALAQPLGMGDDMGRKDDGRALRRFLADQMLQTSLVDRVAPGKRPLEHTQFREVDDLSAPLDRLRPPLCTSIARTPPTFA